VTRAISTTSRRSSHQGFFSPQGKVPKGIHAILTETLGEHAPSCVTVKNWVAQFKPGDFSTCVAPRPGRPKTVTTPEIIEQIHELILEDGSPIHEDLDIRKLSTKMSERGSKTSAVPVV